MIDYDSASSYDSDHWENCSNRICRLDSIYRRYTGWMELKPKWKTRLTDESYTPLNGNKLPSKLVPKLLLKLYEVFSDYDPQRGKVLRKTLAACRLVCREWSKIVTSAQRWFIIRVGDENWLSPVFPYYLLQPTPLSLQDGSRRNQESDTGWCTQNYREDWIKSHPKFLPELIQNILPGFYRRVAEHSTRWEDENRSVIQSTLAACCLVCHEWNRIFTPILYGNVFLGGKKPPVTRSLLHRTLSQTQPTHKVLVKKMTIALAEDGSTANLLSICFSMPYLRKLIVVFDEDGLSKLHPNVVQHLRSLSKFCTIQMEEDGYSHVNIYNWETLPRFIDFRRRSRSISDVLLVESGNTYFYIGNQEALLSGDIGLSNTKKFKEYLTQTGHNLKGLRLHLTGPSSPPEIDVCKNPHLRLLQFNLDPWDEEIEEWQDDILGWFNWICESVTSKSLIIAVFGFTKDAKICKKIQDTLLTLNARMGILSVYLLNTNEFGDEIMEIDDMPKLFSKLYEKGIVIENAWMMMD